MCEVQGVGAPGVGSDREASPPPGRLSVSSSGGEENHSPPRATLLLGHNGESLAGKPSEETSNACKESGEIEASELTPATSSKMKEKEKEEEGEEGDTGEKIMHEGKNEEEEGDIQEKKTDEEEKEIEINGKNMDLEGNSEEEEEVKKEEKEKNVKENESEAQKDDRVQDGVCDEREERENLENERRDEMGESKPKLENVENTAQVETLEITPRMEEEIRTEKTADEREPKEEENRQGNNEQRAASSSDSPKDEKEEEGMKNEEEVETAVKQKEKQENEDKKDKEKQEEEAKNKRGEEDVEDAETEKKDKREEHKREEEKEEEEEGVDPFRSKTTKDSSSSRRGTKIKTVNFLDSELKKQFENNLAKRNTLNSTSSFSSSSSKSKEEEDEEELVRLEGKAEEKSVRQWTLGEGNPVYRLSLKLSPNLFNTTDIPGANQHKEVEKTGFLTKLSGRSFPYIAQWKRRYCVLSKGRLYYYEREDSKEGDKANGVIQLEYFDQVAEAGPKECKKATNVFIITSQDRSFFDPGRHLFSADTLPEMKDWIRRLQAALDQIRNNNRPAASTSPSAPPSAKDGGGKRRREEAAESKDGAKGSQQQNGNKDRKKKKEESGRGRKSSRGGVSSQTQTSMVEPTTSEVDGGRPSTITPKGGVMLPGFSSRKDPQAMGKPAQRRSGDGEAEEDLPQAGPTLQCVTKMRVKGPQGRRVPQNRRMAAAAALKKRASSLSALEHQDAADNSEAPWLNRSLDVLGGGDPWGRRQAGAAVPSTNLPYKAYNYSSDEDDMDDDNSDSFPASASASGMPPPPPPRSASYGVELRSGSQGGATSQDRQKQRRSQADPRGSQGNLVGSRDSIVMWRGSNSEVWLGSRNSLGQNGRASPVMDDLDNLLMNQSVQHSSAAVDTASDAGSEGSSTCRATDHLQPTPGPDQCPHHHHHHHHNNNNHNHHQQQPRKKSHDLNRFTTAVRHLQRHVVEIDRAVFAVTGDVAGTRREVETLREAVTALQSDADTITTTLSNLTQEAITAQQKISFAMQEAEKVTLSVKEALREAEKARQEQLRSRREYEELVAEMRVALQLFRERGPASVPAPAPETAPEPEPVPAAVTKSPSGSQVNKGYQSLFSKSSSIISGLTNRHSLSKSVSFADQKNKERRKSEGTEAKSSSLDRNKKYDKKDKKDVKSQTSVESKDKDSKKDKHSHTPEKKDSKQQQKQKSHPEAGHGDARRSEDRETERKGHGSVDRRERRARQEGRDKRGHIISPLALDDIPLADDVSQEHEAKGDVHAAPPSGAGAAETEHQKTSYKQTLSISLGQPSTSTSGSHPGASSRPQVLTLGRERHSGEMSNSHASPDSPLATSFSRPGSFLPTLEESPPVSQTTSLTSLHQPGSTPGPQARQGAMSTVSKELAAANPSQPRRGTFAISRQHSSPNIPLQRQNSGTAFPIQRQQSLGTVPEGRLPRQESLTSVPEDRPVGDRTLPLSPSPSLTYFPLSPTASSSTLSDTARRAARESMELVTGPVLAGSAMQEANAVGALPALPAGDQHVQPAATSTLKRTRDSHRDNVGILV
ncbi:uncharacterized protein LOC126987770 isoform X2 [Eriocheir sinensis]|uniref:uncharacterized protein LOC126987770 isoform X2 n=1 Tax=Eriocheir sinensis TaxID=95602 RepID=UPI0021C99857|nr:uncharacterized protein LOC126987770 isoform X2 [Eriocheir sinensis]